jgi:beta-glucosidase
MCSYNRINGVYASENRKLLTGILRERWGFDGFVVTDWGAVKDRVQGLRAGLDLEMPGPGQQDAKITVAVRNGTLDKAALDTAVYNMLTFIAGYQKNRKSGGRINYEKDRSLSEEFARECAVLLKNDRSLLPLQKTAKTAFIGEFAKTPRYQGSGSSFINTPHVVSALEAAAGLNITYAQGYRSGEESLDQTLLDEAIMAAKTAEIAVMFVGLPDSIESEGFDRDTMILPENQNRLIEAVAAVQPNTVVVLHTGSPVELPWADRVPAILNMYLGGEGVGSAACALLFGDANPCGKLAETWPLKLADNPSYLNFPGEKDVTEYREGIYVGYRYYDKKEMAVRFPFGHGLSYTTFTYSDLVLNKSAMQDTEKLTVSCTVKNTGKVSGKEAVQVYVRDTQSTVGRPVRELKEFAKVCLASGEEKRLSFTLDKRAFAYYEPKIHDWYVESGIFAVEIGSSSRNIRLCGEVEVRGTVEIPVQFTKNSTVGDLAQTEQGRAIMASFMTAQEQSQPDAAAHNLGSGGDKLIQRMRQEMPLSYMVNLGYMTEEQLEQILSNFKG